jgi:hypothetical protein
MHTDNPKEPITRLDFDIFRRMSWFRVIVGIIGSVLVALVIVNETLRQNQVQGCLRSTEERVATANKDASDFSRELSLSIDATTPTSQRKQHSESSEQAHTAEITLLRLAGSRDPESGILPSNADREHFCMVVYPPSFPNSLWEK